MEELILGDESFDSKIPDTFYVDHTHLDSPLSDDNVLKALNHPHSKYGRELNLIEQHSKISRNCMRTDFHKIIRYLFQLWMFFEPSSLDSYKRVLGYVRKLSSTTPFEGMYDDVNEDVITVTSRKLRSYSNFLHTLNENRGRLRNLNDQSYYEKCLILKDQLGTTKHIVEYTFTSSLCLIATNVGAFLIEHNTFLMYNDLIAERCLISEACDYGCKLDPGYYPSSDRMLLYYDEGDKITEKLGNDGYKAIKLWEPIVTGTIHTKASKPLTDNMRFYNLMVSNLNDELGAGSMECSWVRMLSEETVDVLGELMGMHRLWGHPYTYHVLGVEKNKGYSIKFNKPDEETVNKVLGKFKEMIIVNYFKKNNHYPNLDFNGLVSHIYHKGRSTHSLVPYRDMIREDDVRNDPIIKGIRSGTRIDTSSRMYNSTHWRYIKAKKTFETRLSTSVFDILKDKSCSPNLDELKQSILSKKPVDFTVKRTLSNYLKNNYPEPCVFLDEVDKFGLSKKWLLIGLAKKERELNPAPRLFSLMTMMLKFYFGFTEDMIASDVLTLIKECTMTDSLPELNDKILNSVIFSKKRKGHSVVYIGLDFEKWNLQFRHENTHMFFQFLDELYGYKRLISRTHRIFEECVFYGQDRNNPLEWDHQRNHLKLGPLVWNNQRGGCEGLRQKGWTLITIAMLKVALEDFGIEFYILGQGDNQTIALLIPNPEGKETKNLSDEEIAQTRIKVGEILKSIDKISNNFKLPLKEEETWASSELFSYGKNLFYEGRPLRCTLKRICRMFPYANEDYPSLATGLASISAAAQSASAQSNSILLAYLMGVSEATRLIKRHLVNSPMYEPNELIKALRARTKYQKRMNVAYKWLHNGISDLTFGLLVGCNNLGGAPFMNINDLTTRGSNDKLTQQVTYLTGLRNSTIITLNEKIIIENLLKPIVVSDYDKTLILEDPESLPLKSGVTSKNVLKRSARDLLTNSDFVQNRFIRNLMDIDLQDKQNIVSYLWECEPFAPAVLGTILNATLSGAVDHFIQKFDTTRTMISLARMNGYPLGNRLKSAEIDTICGWLEQLTNPGITNDMVCPTLYSDRLRAAAWGKPIVGITSPCPSHMFTLSESTYEEKIQCNISNKSVHNPESIIKEIGPCYPLLGGETQEKISQSKEWEVKKLPSMVSRAGRLLRAIGWVFPYQSKVKNILEDNLACFTDLEAKYFYVKPDTVTGNFIHRFHDDFRKLGGYVSNLLTASTHFQFNTNHMGEYSRGGVNYALHFQHINVYYACVISHYLQYKISELRSVSINKNPSIQIRLKCKDCLVPLPDQIDILSDPPALHKPAIESNILVPASVLRESILSKLTFASSVSAETMSLDKQSDCFYQICARSIVSNVFKDKKTKLPANWFFGINIERLYNHIREESLAFSCMNFFENVNFHETMTYDIRSLEMWWVNKVEQLQNVDFMQKIIVATENYEQYTQSKLLSSCVPAENPPSDKAISEMIKQSLTISGPSSNSIPYICSGEMNPYKTVLYLFGKLLIKSRKEIRINRQSVLMMLHCKQTLKDIMHKTDGESITVQDLYNSISTNTFKINDPQCYLLCKSMREFIESVYFFNVGTDKTIKTLQKQLIKTRIELEKRIFNEKVNKTYCKLNYMAFGDISDECPLKDLESPIKDQRLLMPTTHGPVLYSLLNDCDNEFEGAWNVIADGSGGTSLALSLISKKEIIVYPYIGSEEKIAHMIELPPPEVMKHNPGAFVRCSHILSIDLNEPKTRDIIRMLNQKRFLVDFDCEPLNINVWLNALTGNPDVTYYLLFTHYHHSSINLIIGKIKKIGEISEVRKSNIVGSNSYLIICKLYNVLDSGTIKKIIISQLPQEEDISYNDIEREMCSENFKPNTYNMYRWISYKTDEQVLNQLMFDLYPYKISRFNHIEWSCTRIPMNLKIATQLTYLWLYYSFCGSFNRRWGLVINYLNQNSPKIFFVPSNNSMGMRIQHEPGAVMYTITRKVKIEYRIRASIHNMLHESNHENCEYDCK